MQKSYTVKIYSITGTYLKTLAPTQIMNEVTFTSRINGGQGECVIETSLPIDDFDEGVSIKQMNFVKVYEIDDTFNTDPVLIYTGYISRYAPFFEEGSEGVRLTLLGLGSLLTHAYFKNGSSFTVTKAATDPAQIIKDIVDHFNGVYSGSWIGYGGGNITTVGTNVDVTFVDQKWFDAINKTADLGGGGRYWRVAEDGQVWYKAKPVAATHQFTIGKDVSTGEVVKNGEQIVNSYQLRWGAGPTAADFSDATSQSAYGKREKAETDSGITASGTATQKGNQVIADFKDPKVQARLRINTQYDIESIKPGDTCSVFNTKEGSTTFPTNMLITSVSYSPDGVDIELENDRSSFADNLAMAVAAIQ